MPTDIQDEIFARFRESYLIGDRKNDIAASITADIVEDTAKKYSELFLGSADISKDKTVLLLVGLATSFEGRIKKDVTPKIKEETAIESRAKSEADLATKITKAVEDAKKEEREEFSQEIIQVVNSVKSDGVKFFFASTALIFGIEGLHYMDAISASLPAPAGTLISGASVLGIAVGGGWSLSKLVKAVTSKPESMAASILKADIKRAEKAEPEPASSPEFSPTFAHALQTVCPTQDFASQAQSLTRPSAVADGGMLEKSEIAPGGKADTYFLNTPAQKHFHRIAPDIPQRPEDKTKVFLKNTLHA